MNVYECIRESRRTLEKDALVEGERKITYQELFRKVELLSKDLSLQGIKKYERVGVLLRDGISSVVLQLALLKLDAVIVPIPYDSTSSEVEKLIDHMKIECLVVCAYFSSLDQVKKNARTSTRYQDWVLFFYDSFLPEQNEFERLNPAFIRYTSGTTAESKGVVISHEAIIERTSAANEVLCLNEKDTVLWVLSMSFHFVVTILLFLKQRTTILLCCEQGTQGMLDGVRKFSPTFLYASPLYYSALVQASDVNARCMQGVRMAISTTSPTSASLAQLFRKKFKIDLMRAYGLIEVGLPGIQTQEFTEENKGTLKVLPAYQARLTNQDDAGVGQLELKGPGMLSAYFNPWKAKEDVLKDGWFVTGDLAKLDGSYNLMLFGRTNQVINFAGMKIFSQEVEQLVMQHPAVKDVCVYGEEHDTFGQIPCAQIVLNQKVSQNFTESEFRKYCYKHLAVYKVPKKIEFIEKISKTKSGKNFCRVVV